MLLCEASVDQDTDRVLLTEWNDKKGCSNNLSSLEVRY
jgi:hypothetical protein